MAYNASTNYQQLIDEAVKRGDMAGAAKYEQQRNEKIAGTGSKQQTTNNYSQYLNQGANAAGQQSQQQIRDVLNRAVGTGKSAGENLGMYTTADGKVTTRRPELAGQTVQLGDKYITYDTDGNPVKAVNAKRAQSYGSEYVRANMGLDPDKTANAGDVYQGLYNLALGGNGSSVSGSGFNNAYGLNNIQYDRTKSLADYDELIRQAAASGNDVLAGYYENSRNALIADQGLDPNLQSARYNGGWNYVDNGGGVGNYMGLRDQTQPNLNLGGGWWQEQDRGDAGANAQWYNNHAFPTMEEVMSYGKALGYDMDNGGVALSPLVRQMIESGYVSPDTLRRAEALKTTVPAALKNLGIEGVDGTGTDALEQTIRVLQQGNGSGGSYADVMAAYSAANGGGSGYGSGGYGAGSLEDQLLGLYGENGGYAKALEQLRAMVDADTQQATNGYNAQKDQVNQSYADMFRQLYIDRENNRKNIGQQMAASGITGGASESTLLGLNTDYEEALRQGEQGRINDLSELEQAIVNAQLSGNREYAQQAMQLYQQQVDNYAGVLQNLLNRQDTLAQQQAALASENKGYAYEQAMALLQAGQMPSNSLLSAAGIDSSTAKSFLSAYQSQNAGSSYTPRRSSGSGDKKQDYDGLFAAALASGHPKSFISNNYKSYGFSSSSGLYDDYTGWASGQEDEKKPTAAAGGNLVSVPGYGQITYDDAEQLVMRGLVKETLDGNGNVKYVLVKQNSGDNIALSR